MRRVLVDREARALGRDLEEHAAGLLEVHRLEPEAIDHVGRAAARGLDLRADRQLVVEIPHRPREMVDRADAPRAAAFASRFPDVDDARVRVEAVARPSALAPELAEAERGRHERGGLGFAALPELRAVESADLALGGD